MIFGRCFNPLALFHVYVVVVACNLTKIETFMLMIKSILSFYVYQHCRSFHLFIIQLYLNSTLFEWIFFHSSLFCKCKCWMSFAYGTHWSGNQNYQGQKPDEKIIILQLLDKVYNYEVGTKTLIYKTFWDKITKGEDAVKLSNNIESLKEHKKQLHRKIHKPETPCNL